MDFIKTIIQQRKLIFQLGKNEFRNKFANTNLGAVWGFVQPFVFMITYVIVFQFILKTNSSGDSPYIVWFLPGMAMWLFLNDTILTASMSIRNYSYLVKKVIFPVDIIPLISMVSSSVVGLFLIFVAIMVCTIMGFFPNLLLILYILLCFYLFVISFTRITSAICTIIPDFSQLLNVVMQLLFWFTPIIWNLDMLKDHPTICSVMKSLPFTYLINGMRSAFINPSAFFKENWIATIVFWVVTLIFFAWGNKLFKRSKKEFADVL